MTFRWPWQKIEDEPAPGTAKEEAETNAIDLAPDGVDDGTRPLSRDPSGEHHVN